VGDGQGNAEDCYGHGTAVAGIAASLAYGVAKDANLWAARVLDCDGIGYASMALAAVDWITANGQLPAVVNMSLSYANTPSLGLAIENSNAAGFVYAIAAGNQIVPFDACDVTPANVRSALTVGATDENDVEASWSGFGNCVDLLAPGVNITSTSYTADAATEVGSGTSLATPHVAGAAALYLGEYPGASPGSVMNVVVGSATVERVTLHSASAQNGTPNRLLHTNFLPIPPNNMPNAAMTWVCTELACEFSGSTSSDSDGSVVNYLWDFGDGFGYSSVSPTASHDYASDGTYTVKLTVMDNAGATNGTSDSVVVASDPPDAEFSLCSNIVRVVYKDSRKDREIETEVRRVSDALLVHFDASASTNAGGPIIDYLWDFGDGETGQGIRTSHRYNSDGNYTVTLTVVNDLGLPGTATKEIAATGGGSASTISLSAERWQPGGASLVDLNWTGGAAYRIDVFRDGSRIATVHNNGSFTDGFAHGPCAISYQVCDRTGGGSGRLGPIEG
jgi:PKD repeat protein